MKKRLGLLLLLAAASAFGAESNWKQILSERLPLYGHRNWIVVADSAYPAQSREGIETIVSGAGQVDVLKQVLGAISASKHVRAVVHTDQELKFVEEKEAPGVSAYRQQLAALLGNQKVNELPHEQIIAKLDQVSRTFRVLIIKTNMTIPYTSVFLELNAGYWGADSEAKLRARMAGSRSH
jgi:L-fucose mutarotase/ribose pyranase (RbsD/FucU family)